MVRKATGRRALLGNGKKYDRRLRRIDIHLTMTAIEFETEATTVAQDERQWLAPGRTLSTVFDAVPQTVTDTMTALHDRTIATLQLIGRQRISAIEGCRLVVGDIIEVRGER